MSKTANLHKDIIEACKQNDAKAQMKLYDLYCKGMFLAAKRYIKDDMLAEDVMQESFIKAFKKIHTYKGDVPFGAWLKRIVINGSIDELKRKKLEIVSINQELQEQKQDDSWYVDDRISTEKVIDCIDKLKEKYKVVVSLYLLEGYDHQEISQILGISEVTSRTHLMRGKKMIQENLKAIQYAEGY